MELPSSVGLLLRGFDRWVVETRPSCEVASRVLRCLQRASSQMRCIGAQSVPSIPILLQTERFGRTSPGAFQISTLPMDALLF